MYYILVSGQSYLFYPLGKFCLYAVNCGDIECTVRRRLGVHSVEEVKVGWLYLTSG
jgi:hypothetical protein